MDPVFTGMIVNASILSLNQSAQNFTDSRDLPSPLILVSVFITGMDS